MKKLVMLLGAILILSGFTFADNVEDELLEGRQERVEISQQDFALAETILDGMEKLPTANYLVNEIGKFQPFVDGGRLHTAKQYLLDYMSKEDPYTWAVGIYIYELSF